MNKLVVVAAVMSVAPLVNSAFAEETAAANKPAAPASAENAAEEVETEEPTYFEAGFDFDFLSAYVWRNAVQTDDMVMQPCVWGDFTYFEPFWFGFSIWQNYDLTNRRRPIYRHALNETDYNLHIGATAWSSDDEDYELGIELGHDWYTYNGVRSDMSSDYPDTRELYLKLSFDNPFVNIYAQASWMYDDFGAYNTAMHYEIGFTKEIELTDTLTLGADWNVNFGDGRYLYFLYGGTASGSYDHSDDPGDPDVYDDYGAKPDAGFAGTTIKFYLTWQMTDNLSLGGVIGYTGVLNDSVRDAMDEQGGDFEMGGHPNEKYPRDLLWGGLQLKLSY